MVRMTWIRTTLSALLAALLLVFTAGPALAHDQLISSTPGYEQNLTELPTQIELEYNAEIIDAAPAVLIRDSGNTTVYQATPTAEGRFVRAPFPELDDGAYTLSWSVVSSDGHRIEGAIPFTLSTGRVSSSAPVTQEAPSMDETTQAATGTASTDTPAVVATPISAASGLTLSGPFAVAAIVAGIGAVAALAALAIKRLRNWR